MRFELRTTSDGSLTVFDAEAGECFKSRHAARLEVEEVFVRPGIRESALAGASPFRVLELGFGLGTNFLALEESGLPLEFVSVERDLMGARFFQQHAPHPALAALLASKRHACDHFSAELLEGDFFTVLPELPPNSFHAVFFDPFSPKANPDAWTPKLFRLTFELLMPGGRLVTYSVSRAAKDAAKSAGFEVEKRDLPPGLQKRSALLATKPAAP